MGAAEKEKKKTRRGYYDDFGFCCEILGLESLERSDLVPRTYLEMCVCVCVCEDMLMPQGPGMLNRLPLRVIFHRISRNPELRPWGKEEIGNEQRGPSL